MKSNSKLIGTIVVGSLLLPLTVHATVINSQFPSQDMSHLVLLALGLSSLAMGRRFQHR